MTVFERVSQEIQVNGSASGNTDLLVLHKYGVYSNMEYLPYSKVNNNGGYDTNATAESNWSYLGSEEQSHAFTLAEFDGSALQQIVKQTGPGKAWHDGHKGVTTSLQTNSTNQVKIWSVDGSGQLTGGNTYYPENMLIKTVTTDENGHVTEEFMDRDGYSLLHVTLDGNSRLETYSVHDDRGLLRYVLSPEASVRVGTTATRNTEVIRQYGYYYEYDNWGRQTLKQLPGCDPVYMVYDKRDRMVMSQDGKQRAENVNKWSYSLYDEQNRVIETGEVILSKAATPSGLQTEVAKSGNYIPAGTRTALQYTEYDVYTSNALPFVPTSGYSTASSTLVTGQVTTTRTRVLGESKLLTASTYYDSRGRVIQTVANNYLGYKSVVNMAYDFAGNVTKSREAHGFSATGTDVLETVNTYDDRGRLLSTTTKLNNGLPATTTCTYDAVGRLVGQKYGNLQETLAYNSRGWLTSKESAPFKMKLRYESPQQGKDSCFNGNISEWEWQQGTNTAMMYGFKYDGVNRLKGSTHYQRSGNTWSLLAGNSAFDEKGLTYDKNGNILTLTRTGSAPGTQSYTYTGNQLKSVTKGGVVGTYTHDKNGNMINDSRKALNLSYNVLNLLSAVNTGTTRKATYTYGADGTKLKVLDGSGNGICYLGSLTYMINGSSTSLEGAMFGGGRIVANSSTRAGNELRYFLTDHLGSTRVIVDQNGTVRERDDYYPFGGRYVVAGGNVDTGSRWKYNGKEEQVTGNLGWLDYGARMYDWELGRWFGVDPVSESYNSWSPYNYTLNNPIRFIDPNGMWLGDPPSFLSGWNNRVNEYNNNVWSWIDTRSSKPGLLFNDLGDFAGGILNLLSDITGISNAVTGQNKTADALGNAIQTISKIPSMSSEELGSFTASSFLLLGEFAASRKIPLGEIGSLGKIGSATKKGGNAFRYVSGSELKAIQETGLLRGGRPGETFFTKDLFKTAAKAQNRLSLPTSPNFRVEFQILNNPTLLRNGTKILPANGMTGKGSEFMTLDFVKVKIINWQPLK